MTNYYYTANPDVEHQEKVWQFTLLNHPFTFVTDNGVFSKNTVDYGSRVLLDALAKITLPAGNILDVGCGYGPIGLAIAKIFPDRTVTMVDVNNLALSLCQRNAELNTITNVEIFPSSCYKKVTQTDYALIVTNPPVRAGKEIVSEILRDSYQHLKGDGSLVCVLQKKQGAPSAKKLMTEVFGNCKVIARDKGYFILHSVKTK